MISNPKNITTSTGLQKGQQRKIDYFQFVSMFLLNNDYEFADIDAFQDHSVWITGIKNRFIFPFLEIKQVRPDHESDNYQNSILKYEYKAYNGKYRFNLDFLVPIDYKKIMNTFSGQDYSVIFVDANNYVHAYSPDGTKIKGLETNLIDMGKIDFGNGSAAFSPLRVELHDPDQYNNLGIAHKFDTPISYLEVVFVLITNISGTSSTINFTVKDENFDCPISGLQIADITLDDQSGAQTIGTLLETNPGVYEASGVTPGLTTGQIEIDTNNFFGAATYIFSGAAVSASNIVYTSETEITFDVRLDTDSSLVTGLLVGDFTLTDAVNGVLGIGAFSEVSTGRYNFSGLTGTPSNAMTTGTIDISSTQYTGSDPYDLDIDVTMSGFTSSQPAVIRVTVTQTVSGNPLTTLGNTDWVITDDVTGSVSVTSTNHLGSGLYELSLAEVVTSGDLAVSTTTHSGSDPYNYIQTEFRNGGGAGTTDWTNPTSGVAEYWSQQAPLTYKDASIVTGNGFTGNAQRGDSLINDSAGFLLLSDAIFFKPGQDYQLSLKHRSDKGIDVAIFTDSGSKLSDTISSNIGNAASYTSATFTPLATDTGMTITFNADKLVTENGYVEIDEVELIEV